MNSQGKSEKKVKNDEFWYVVKMNCGREKAIEEENRRIRWLRIQVDLARAVLYQDQTVSLQQARELVSLLRERVIERFPGKEHTFDLVILPRFERILRERWGAGFEQQENKVN